MIARTTKKMATHFHEHLAPLKFFSNLGGLELRPAHRDCTRLFRTGRKGVSADVY